MTTGAERRTRRREPTTLLCLIPPDLSDKLLEPLRRHYGQAGVEVEVMKERRSGERRRGKERRKRDKGPPKGTTERRLIKNEAGRRVGERRATLLPIDPPVALPRKARAHADRISFFERIPIPAEQEEELDTGRLVTRIQAGDRELFAALYERYFDRVFAYLRVLLRNTHEAEDATQQAFVKVLEAIPRYERLRPFDAWLFTVVRNVALDQLRKQGRIELEDAEQLDRRRELAGHPFDGSDSLEWIRDEDLLVLIERLPHVQQQVLMLRFMMDLPATEVARILGRTETDIRTIQYRALRFLEQRLRALGRAPAPGRRRHARPCTRQATVLRSRRFALS